MKMATNLGLQDPKGMKQLFGLYTSDDGKHRKFSICFQSKQFINYLNSFY